MKQIMTTLQSLGKQDWKKNDNVELEKLNKLVPYISTGNFTEVNELIYAGAGLVCDEIGVPITNPKRNTKTGWEIRLEEQERKLQHQTKMLRKKKYARICLDKKKTVNKCDKAACRYKSKDIGERRETLKNVNTK